MSKAESDVKKRTFSIKDRLPINNNTQQKITKTNKGILFHVQKKNQPMKQ